MNFKDLTRYQLEAFNLKKYLKAGGDINKIEDGKYPIEYFFSDLNDKIGKRITELLSHADTFTYKPEIQNELVKNWMYISHPVKKQEIFIKKFDLNNNVLASQDQQNYNLSTTWHLFFMAGQDSFNLLISAHDYHPDFQNKLKDKGMWDCNIWHYFANYLTENIMSDDIPHERVFEILMKDFPEGLLEKNSKAQTPLEFIVDRQAKQSYKNTDYQKVFDSFTDKIEKATQYVKLNVALLDNKKTKSSKI
jgi:hypothetical protein